MTQPVAAERHGVYSQHKHRCRRQIHTGESATWVRINNMDFAAGYQLCLENLRGNYLATQYRVGTDRTKDSDLRLDSAYLTSTNEFIVPAADAYSDATETRTVHLYGKCRMQTVRCTR